MTETFRYPTNLGTKQDKKKDMPYVQFRIANYHEPTLFSDFLNTGSTVRDLNSMVEIDNDVVEFKDVFGIAQEYVIAAKKLKEKTGLYNSRRRTPTVFSDIFLPIPQNLLNTYVPMWQMEDMYLLNGLRDTYDRALAGELEKATISGIGSLMAAVQNNNGGMYSQKMFGITPNPKKQAFFTGIEPRTFTFEYVLSAQTEEEAQTIQKIANSFSKYSLPRGDVLEGSFWGFPAEFKINFFNVEGFPVIEWCVCTGISINYSPGSMQLLKSGHPIQIGLVMTFQETSLRTQETPGTMDA